MSETESFAGQTRWQFLKHGAESESGLGLTIPIVFSLIIFITGLGGANPAPGGLSPMMTDISTGITVISIFLIFRFIRRFTKFIVNNIFVWAIAGVLGSQVAFFLDAVVRGQISMALFPFSIVGSVSFATNLGGLGFIWTGWSGTRQLKLELAQITQSLTERKNSTLQEIAFLRNTTFAEVKAQLLGVLENLQNIDGANFSKQLLDLVDNVIRPISKRLTSNEIKSLNKKALLEETEPEAVAPIRANQITSPILFVASCLLFSSLNSFVFFGPLGLVLEIIATSLGLVMQVAWSRSASGIAWSKGVQFWAIAITTAMPGLIFFIPTFSDQSNLVLSMTMLLGRISISLAITGFLLITATRMNAIEARNQANAEIAVALTRLQQEEWFERERLARAIHGQVQSKILIAALRISKSESVSTEVIAEIRSDLSQAIDALDATVLQTEANFEAQLQGLIATWAGACQLSIDLEPGLAQRLNQDSVASACAIEILREAVANASKHSSAEKVAITISKLGSSRIMIAVSNSGDLAAKVDRRVGYGTQLMNDLSSSWSLKQSGTQTLLRATLELR